MPLAQITMMEGRTKEQKAELIKEVTDCIHRVLNAPKDTVRVAIYEVGKSDWGIGGRTAESLGR